MNFKSLWPLSRETQLALIKSKQFGEKEFEALLPVEFSDMMEIVFEGKSRLQHASPSILKDGLSYLWLQRKK